MKWCFRFLKRWLKNQEPFGMGGNKGSFVCSSRAPIICGVRMGHKFGTGINRSWKCCKKQGLRKSRSSTYNTSRHLVLVFRAWHCTYKVRVNVQHALNVDEFRASIQTTRGRANVQLFTWTNTNWRSGIQTKLRYFWVCGLKECENPLEAAYVHDCVIMHIKRSKRVTWYSSH